MSIKERFFRVSHLLFIIFVLAELLLPAHSRRPPLTGYALGFAAAVDVLLILISAVSRDKKRITMFNDLGTVIFAVLLIWELLTAKFNVVKPVLFPPLGILVHQFIEDIPEIANNIVSSLGIILEGYLLGLLGIPAGLFLATDKRISAVSGHVAGFLGAIPPIVYIPYGIALLPTFRSVSVLVIFLATFWPVFMGTISGVNHVDKRILDSARVLNLSRLSTIFHVILPASLTQIFVGANLGLCISFILLTSAEMIGARAGLGFYVKNYSDLGDYTRAIVGIVIIGVVVVLSTWLVSLIQKRLLRWQS
ncbi:MAG: ABC transporter permease subunit [Ruminobacter sp.]|jgi:NitT/TauT family transport system permease protein|nr:ABC transporter permease subunit [Ruminobacter sp.]MBR1924731.1 ABC transporter permease subunit [Ruminobacter sp.]